MYHLYHSCRCKISELSLIPVRAHVTGENRQNQWEINYFFKYMAVKSTYPFPPLSLSPSLQFTLIIFQEWGSRQDEAVSLDPESPSHAAPSGSGGQTGWPHFPACVWAGHAQMDGPHVQPQVWAWQDGASSGASCVCRICLGFCFLFLLFVLFGVFFCCCFFFVWTAFPFTYRYYIAAALASIGFITIYEMLPYFVYNFSIFTNYLQNIVIAVLS